MSLRLILAASAIATLAASAGIALADSDDHHSSGHVEHSTLGLNHGGCDATDPERASACGLPTHLPRMHYWMLHRIKPYPNY